MLVKDLMSREVVLIEPTASLKEALKLMDTKNVKSLVVNKKYPHDAYGMITYTDIIKAVFAEEGDIELLNVYDIYKKPALSISKELEIKHAAKLMIKMGIKRLLVTDNNELEGIISMHDIIKEILKNIKE
jgi:predicted transcriptional regulator